jgi:hypothetical protein
VHSRGGAAEGKKDESFLPPPHSHGCAAIMLGVQVALEFFGV